MRLVYRGPVQGVYVLDGNDEVRYTVVGKEDDPQALVYQGDEVNVPDEVGQKLLEQDTWEKPKAAAAKPAPAGKSTPTPGA